MAASWPLVPLRNLITLRKGVSYKGEFLDKPGPRLLGLGTIELGGGILLGKAAPYGGPLREHQRAQPGDLLLAVVGITPVGSVIGSPARIPEDAKGQFAFTHHVAKVLPQEKAPIDLRFLYYLFRAPAFHAYVWQMQSGSTVPEIALNDVLAFPIGLPSLPEQCAIAHILGTLDAKIELNRRISETLEAMARVLFKSWFVDFDPVRAKAEGRDPGLPEPLADLFPARLVDSEFGEIPEGWEVKALDEIARFLNGLALQKYPPVGERSLPVIKIAQLRAGKSTGADRASADLDPDYIVQDGDILFSWSGSLECALWAGGNGALNQHLFKVTSANYPRWLCYLAIHHHLDDFRHIAAGKATTMGHIQRHHLSGAMLTVPGEPLLRSASVLLDSILESIWKRNVESRNLAALRDTLLPKLISGALRLEDAEKFLGRTA